MDKSIKNMITEFEKFLFEEEKAQLTAEKYSRDVRKFAQFINDKELSKEMVLLYKKELIKHYAPKSVNSMLSSINAFFGFLGRNDLKVKTLKIQKEIFASKSKELTKAEYERLLCEAQKRKNQRLYLLLQTICSTGIRVSELKFITKEAVDEKRAIINCKGKLRQVFLPKRLCKALMSYIKSNKIKKGPVFVTKNGNPLDRSNVWKMLKKLCDSANVMKEKVFPHNLRHLFARTFYSVQKDIVRLADILGHSSINTTRIYTKETGEIHCLQLQKLGLLMC